MHHGDARDGRARGTNVGEVHAVGDVSVFDIVNQFFCRHLRAVVLRFGRACAEVGDADDVLYADELVGREVGDVAFEFSALHGGKHCVRVDQFAAGIVDEYGAVLHFRESVRIEHLFGVGRERNVYGDEIGRRDERVKACRPDPVIEVQCARDGKVGVIADHVHTEIDRRVRDHYADRAQADDAERFTRNLVADKLGFALFDGFSNALGAFERLHPVDRVGDLSAAEEQFADDQLFDRVCVGAGGVEYDDALCRAGGDGDIVRARARARHGEQFVVQGVFVHVEAAQHDAVGVGGLFRKGIARGEFFVRNGADFIQFENLRHGYRFLLITVAPFSSGVFLFEFLHEFDELFHAFYGHRVVDGSAHAAHKAVSFQGHETFGLSLFHEFFVRLFGRGDERHVHDGAVLLFYAVGVVRRVIDEIVQKPRFVFVDLVDLFDAAQLFEVAQYEVRHINGEAGGRIVEGAVVRLRFPFEHGGADGQRVFDEIFARDDDGHARGGEVFLRARIDDAEFCHVYFAGQDLRAHVAHERLFRFGEFDIAGAENGIVRADVHVIGIVVEFDRIHVGDVCIIFILGRGDFPCLAVDLAFLPGFFGKVARHDVIGLSRVHQVEGNGCKLLARAALYKQYTVIVGNVHQLAHERLRFFHDGGERFVPVADLRDAHTGSLKIKEFFLRLFEHFEGEHGRACRKVINSHNQYLLRFDRETFLIKSLCCIFILDII